MDKHTLLILNGPGLTDPGACSDEMYGDLSLDQIHVACTKLCKQLAIELDWRQTDDASEMFDWISKAGEKYDGLVINPSSGSHATSIDSAKHHSAIKLAASNQLPMIEVRISNIFREDLEGGDANRQLQATESGVGLIAGLGEHGYLLAIKAIHRRLNQSDSA